MILFLIAAVVICPPWGPPPEDVNPTDWFLDGLACWDDPVDADVVEHILQVARFSPVYTTCIDPDTGESYICLSHYFDHGWQPGDRVPMPDNASDRTYREMFPPLSPGEYAIVRADACDAAGLCSWMNGGLVP